ncbi:hypothetical protein [Streptomyces fuscigenes]|uniref:hypothetical protein n=1 Tax=Streptomyces fuscigenes TaxID=1528880 RepID=UPI001F4398CD|nr:hypothetical protein [Streptomyces fuscigenes]MCF3962764.1 hypothetical protein [Streptomyces fuscigenes]
MTEMTGSPAAASQPPDPLDPLDPQRLSDEQRRGGACVHCALPVATGSAVDLGPRTDADGTRIYPRTHPGCLGDAP